MVEHCRTVAAVVLSLCFICVVSAANLDEHFLVRIRNNGDMEKWEQLKRMTLNWDHHRTRQELDAYVTNEELTDLTRSGYDVSKVEQHYELETREVNGDPVMSDSGNIQYDKHYNYADMTTFLQTMADKYEDITELTSIGKTKDGHDLWVLEISKNPGINEEEPEFKYVANMHGDEVVGRQLALYLIDYLCFNYKKDSQVTTLVDSIDIYIMPSMNPDGYELRRRENSNYVDLNRNFPDQFIDKHWTTAGRQLEVQAVMNWSSSKHFVLSANFHGGSVCANYPFDSNSRSLSTLNSPSPDDEVFRKVALTYSLNHPSMYKGEFFAGITNGAEWYVLNGGMQDWNYLSTGDLELTIELTDVKWPAASSLPNHWSDNKASMLAYMQLVLTMGVYGTVKDANTGKPLNATISIKSIPGSVVRTDPQVGDYYRLVVSGTYVIVAAADGYSTQEQEVDVYTYRRTQKNFLLRPANGTDSPITLDSTAASSTTAAASTSAAGSDNREVSTDNLSSTTSGASEAEVIPGEITCPSNSGLVATVVILTLLLMVAGSVLYVFIMRQHRAKGIRGLVPEPLIRVITSSGNSSEVPSSGQALVSSADGRGHDSDEDVIEIR